MAATDLWPKNQAVFCRRKEKMLWIADAKIQNTNTLGNVQGKRQTTQTDSARYVGRVRRTSGHKRSGDGQEYFVNHSKLIHNALIWARFGGPFHSAAVNALSSHPTVRTAASPTKPFHVHRLFIEILVAKRTLPPHPSIPVFWLSQHS
jgi:hypothetical protein